MFSRRTILRRLVVLAFALSTIAYSYGGYRELCSLAWSLRKASMDERRRLLFAPWYGEVMALRARVPPTGAVDIIMLRPEARDVAVLSGPLLYPRDTRYFDGWQAWRQRRRATFLHDVHAANAAPGPPPPAANLVVTIDPTTSPMIEIVP